MKGKVYPMKQLLIILLVCAVGYLLYDKFNTRVDGFIQGRPIKQGGVQAPVQDYTGGRQKMKLAVLFLCHQIQRMFLCGN